MSLRLLKIKTLVVVLVLFLVTLSLGIATYSWYIVSTAPTIRAVETYMKVIDPVISIARATDENTPPQEVSNQDARDNIEGSSAAQDKYYDITWGAIVDSFQNDNLSLEFPATYDENDRILKTASFSQTDMRLDRLVPVGSTRLGYNTDGEYGDYGLRYYTCPDGKTVCAVGLGVWLRINQPDHDLVVSVANTSVKDAEGNVVVPNENVKVGIRVISESYRKGSVFIPTEYNTETGTHMATLYDADDPDIGPFPENDPILIEVVVYMEGDTGSTASGSQTGLRAKDVDKALYINIESVTFYDNKYVAQ